jgi:flagellin-like protein
MRKGVSPLIATIMLISFTLLVGAIMVGWVNQYATGQRTSFQRCQNAKVLLQRGSYDSGAKNLTLVINNYGNVDLAFVPIILQSGATTKLADKIYVAAGGVTVYNITDIEPTLEEITIQSVDCDPPCYRCVSAQDLLVSTDIKGL